MMRSPELRQWLNVAVSNEGLARCVLIPGGGALADHVRELQATWKFDDAEAQALALEAMRMNARVLHILAPAAGTSSDVSAIAGHAEHGQSVIWSPPVPLTTDAFPASWDATSDSVALYVAQSVAADALFLVKSVHADRLVDGAAATLSGDGVLDDFFPQLLARERITARIVAKSQYADFAEAYRQGDATRAGIAITGA